jgi:hypothetical protein
MRPLVDLTRQQRLDGCWIYYSFRIFRGPSHQAA